MVDQTHYKIISLKATDTVPTFPKMKVNRQGWVDYGPQNDFPQQVIAINGKSPVNSAIIASTVTYICGKGVRNSRPTANTYVGAPNPTESWDDVIEKIATDYKSQGGFYFQVIPNKDSKTVSIYHQDYSAVRIGQIDEKGRPLTFRISHDWKKTSGKLAPIEIPAWPGMDKAEQGTAYLFHYYDYVPGMQAYTVPGYFSALEYAKADGKLATFYNNSIDNGFTPSVVISMPSNPDEPKKQQFQTDMEDSFGGSNGASAIVVLWGENETVKPVITPFQASANADIYNNIEGIIFQKLISANRLSSPTLAGISGSGNLSGNAAEIIDAYILYNYTVVEKLRAKILDKLNLFTKINGTAPLVIDELDVLPKIQSTTSPIGAASPTTAASGEAPTEALATKIGVSGTQALTAIIENPNMDIATKKGLLKTLFGLADEEISALFGEGPATLQRKETRFKAALKKFMDLWK